MQRLTRIFLEVSPCQADCFARAVVQRDSDFPLSHDRQRHLRDLVALGQVRVEVILASKDRRASDLSARGQAKLDGHSQHGFIQHRQNARQTQINRVGLRVRLGTKGGGRSGKNFALTGELGVDFQPDDCFPLHLDSPPIDRPPAYGGASL